MSYVWKEGHLAPAQKRVLLWAIVALAACLAMNGYHYSLEGAKGLYIWNNTGLFRFLLLMGFIPATVALLSFPLEKLKSKDASRIFRGASLVLSLVVILASLGIAALLVAGPRLGSLEPARLNLINPVDGITPRQPINAAFQSGSAPAAPSVAPSAAQTAAPAMPQAAPSSAVQPLLRLSFSSDPHWGADASNVSARTDILANIAENKPDAFFILGDTVETGSTSMMWNFALSDLEAIMPKIPLRPLMGNHDALLGGEYLYKKAFFPAGFKSDSGSPYYYSIDAKAATIIVLDLPWGTENFNKKQKTWLERVLREADRTKPIIALSHSYFYASGYDDPSYDKPWYDHYQNIPAVTPLFEQYGVDLVISGHNHYQEYLERSGVRYAIIGGMGGISDPPPKYISPATKWMAVATFGWLDVDILPAEVVLSFRNERGEPLHEERFGY
ncbi:MAG TPA: metallophosphoesterase [Rectinemataceae bacterium]|nr:metallophosphoesterase [Rectinemataceae bacterium]